MTEIIVMKLPNGTLAPATDEDAEELRKIKTGAGVRVKLTRIRNYKFLRKWFVLAKYAFEIWSDDRAAQMYKGHEVAPNFDRFREDLVILTGHYDATFSINGEVRLRARSISFAKMDEAEFEMLYSSTINVILAKVLTGRGFTEEQIRNYVDNVMSYE